MDVGDSSQLLVSFVRLYKDLFSSKEFEYNNHSQLLFIILDERIQVGELNYH